MKLCSATIKGFRSFGNTPTTIDFEHEVTALIGPNGSGKTALLEALLRLFGVTREQRTVKYKDFYVDPGMSESDRATRTLRIDTKFVFPELETTDASSYAVAPCLKHMDISEPGATPYCHIRLEAQWVDDGTVDGSIEQEMWWVLKNEDKRKIEPHERGLIQVHYVPAIRDASSQLGYSATTIAGRLLRATKWSSKIKESFQNASKSVQSSFKAEDGVDLFNKAVEVRWKDLNDTLINSSPELRIVGGRFEDAVRQVSMIFQPSETGGEQELDTLSDGQRSLFYFSLVSAVFDIEQSLVTTAKNSVTDERRKIYDLDQLKIPALTIFALEEPENHLSPYFLNQIIKQVRSIVQFQTCQSIITSHSPAILQRVQPNEVRYFRLQSADRSTVIKKIFLPDEPDEAAKYIREAIVAYPELYFARFVILGEGDSEEIVLPRIASALGLNVDRSFVAIVPLGGRHVNHFWRLLTDLDIPYATLLDFDLGRDGAGWQRIKYIYKQLLSIDVDKQSVLTGKGLFPTAEMLSDDVFDEDISWNKSTIGLLYNWFCAFEQFGVFFSEPLDIDLMMLTNFLDQYKSVAGNNSGPRIPDEQNPEHKEYMKDAIRAVLGKSGSVSYYIDDLHKYVDYFPWYRYLFLGKSKPSSHIYALSQIEDEQIKSKSPKVLKRLLEYAAKKINSGTL